MSRLFGWDYPPGVTGSEPEIIGEPEAMGEWDLDPSDYESEPRDHFWDDDGDGAW